VNTFFRFREDRILHEQVKLVYRNYWIGLLGLFCVISVATTVLHLFSDARGIFYLLIVSAVMCLTPLIFQWLNRHKAITNPRAEAKKQITTIFLCGVLWSAYILLYIDGESLPIMVLVIGFTTGVVSAALVMQSACLPVYLAFAYTTVPSLIVALILLDSAFYNLYAMTAILYLFTMTLFGVNMEATFAESIRLRIENEDLVQQLQSSIDEVNEANEVKSFFLASASHDLRQPLHAMSLFIQSLKATDLDEYQQEITAYIESSSQASSKILTTLLDFSKLDAGVVSAEPSAFRLQPLLNKLENELAIEADNKGIIYRTHETTAIVNTDKALLEMILRNFISNAIRYTETGGVLIACRKRANKKLLIEVWDTGMGIDTQQGQNIFKEFTQLHNPERDRQKGFGLGLAIVERLGEILDAPISFNSKLGQGSVFRVLVDAADSVVDAVIEKTSTQANEQKLAHFPNTSVLIIDDDESILKAMKALLTSWGCQCLMAISGEEGLALLQNQSIDLLIVDYRLQEGKTGGDAIQLLRKHSKIHLPAIIITGDTAADRLQEAQKIDALLLHKPVNHEELQKAMQNLL